MDQNYQNVLLVMTQNGFQTFAASTLPISFFSIKLSISIALDLKQSVGF